MNNKLLELMKSKEYDFEAVTQAAKDIYNKGAWHGGFALLGGMAIGATIQYGVEHLMTKKKKGVDESK